MCGRYVLAMRPSEIRRMLEANDMPVDDAPPDDGPLAPRHSYNFAPTYHGVVLRAAEAPRPRPRPRPQDKTSPFTRPAKQQQHYILQTMKWGLVPSWTGGREQPYTATLKTINCRDDSLAQNTGLWARLRDRKRCVVVADGFYEWLKVGKQRVPYYVKRRDGRPMLLAGLWDYVPPTTHGKGRDGKAGDEKGKDGKAGDGEGEGGLYSYTIITTSSCEALRFLHDRMPVVLEAGGEEMRLWLGGGGWGTKVREVLRPWEEEGGLDVYRVSGDVGRVGRDEKRFVEPVEGGRGDIAGWFLRGEKGKGGGGEGGDGEKGHGDAEKDVEVEVKDEEGEVKREMKSVEEVGKQEADVPVTPTKGVKREAEGELKDEPSSKKKFTGLSLSSPSPVKSRPKISPTKNVYKSPKKAVKGKGDGNQKITKFFGNSA